MLVTLVPSNLPMTTVVGLYSLNRSNLGDCYATYRYGHTYQCRPDLIMSLSPCSLESSAVSVSLSPTSRHLLVGLTSRTSRIISLSPMDRQLMAQVDTRLISVQHLIKTLITFRCSASSFQGTPVSGAD